MPYLAIRIGIGFHKQFLTEEKMEKCFNQLDQEGNGFLTKQKIKSCIFANRNIDQGVISELFNDVDLEKDNQLSYEEFKKLLQQLLQREIKS